ncbi:MAG: hypothetical protein COA57_02855 [Flavobacteriales bacterium]|nr:hypothetical protein [Bacteroidales bacterium AH-315-I05]PCJ89056.1 MAG: hypothetical protein COA57_02855 [Flavobacteriales bacterium]
MKKLIVLSVITAMNLVSFSQNPDLPSEQCLVVLKNKKLIKKVRLWEINPNKLEYEREGSLHDLPIEKINMIKTDDEIISFDEFAKLIIRPYDLIITNSNDTIKCTIIKISADNIYCYKQKGHLKSWHIPIEGVLKYIWMYESISRTEFSDDYYKTWNSGQSVKNKASNTAKEVNDIPEEDRKNSNNLPDTISVETEAYYDNSNQTVNPAATGTSNNNLDLPKVSGGRVAGQFFAGAGVGLGAGGIGFLFTWGISGFSNTDVGLVGFTLGSAVGSTVMVYVIGRGWKKYAKSSLAATALGGLAGSVGSAVIMANLSNIDGYSGQTIGFLFAAALPPVGALIGFYSSRKNMEPGGFSIGVNPAGVSMAYKF